MHCSARDSDPCVAAMAAPFRPMDELEAHQALAPASASTSNDSSTLTISASLNGHPKGQCLGGKDRLSERQGYCEIEDRPDYYTLTTLNRYLSYCAPMRGHANLGNILRTDPFIVRLFTSSKLDQKFSNRNFRFLEIFM